MFCKNCGNEIADAAVVCPKCGVPVDGKQLAPATEQVSNHMVGAILTTIFCCQIGGIIAIIYAAQVNSKLARGDIGGAQSDSKTAYTWIIVNVITGLLVTLFFAFIGIVGAIAE